MISDRLIEASDRLIAASDSLIEALDRLIEALDRLRHPMTGTERRNFIMCGSIGQWNLHTTSHDNMSSESFEGMSEKEMGVRGWKYGK